MVRVDPGDKAAECERAIEVIADPERRAVLNSLRSLWLALGNKQALFGPSGRPGPLWAISQIRTESMSVCRHAMH
jgi:hypothetical protein